MTARRVQVRITRERTGLGDLVAEVACPGCGTRAEFIGYPSAIEIADGRVRCCRPLQDDLVRDPAASPRGLAGPHGRRGAGATSAARPPSSLAGPSLRFATARPERATRQGAGWPPRRPR